MLESYKVVRGDTEDVLYLYLNVNYEFAFDFDHDDLKEKAAAYVLTHNIDFKGNKVVFVINGIETKEINLNSYNIYSNNFLIALNTMEKLTLKELLISLLFSNIGLDLYEDTLKAIVILYKSDIIRNLDNNKLDINKLTFNYINYNYYKLAYKDTFSKYFSLYNKIVDEVDFQYLIYDNKPIKAYIHLVSNGYTETDHNAPYLIKKESLWDLTYPGFMQSKTYSIEEVKRIFNIDDDNFNIKITKLSNSNTIKEMEINNRKIKATLLSALLNLASCDITMIVKKDRITFITRGIGNNKGLSIIGANNLAEMGLNYKQILNYYFQNLVLVIK